MVYENREGSGADPEGREVPADEEILLTERERCLSLTMQARKHVRFAVQRPVSFRGDFVAGTGTILNISRQGCAIVSDTAAEAQAYLQLQVQLLEEEAPVQVDLAAVRWSNAKRFGVEFIKMPQEVGERIRQFVNLLELEE